MHSPQDSPWSELTDHEVVLDLASHYVVLGRLVAVQLNIAHMLDRVRKALPCLEEVLPRVFALQAREEISEIEFRRIEIGLDLRPRERSGDRCVRFSTNGIGAHDGMHLSVPKRIEIDAIAARRNRVFDSQLVWVRCGEPRRPSQQTSAFFRVP